MSEKEKKQLPEKKNHLGRCDFCGEVFGKRAMATHLKSCRVREREKANKVKVISALQLLIEGRHIPEYWLQVAVPVNSKLQVLDRFLRNIWLE
jgi:ribosomal protein S14